MALIDCPDCSNKLSDTARACPQCARPMRTEKKEGTEFPCPVYRYIKSRMQCILQSR